MTKRFTDTKKWQDEWYLSLNNDERTIWQFILDTCTPAGRWKKNFLLLNFCCRVQINEDMFSHLFGSRVIDRGNYFFIPKFLKFQYPKGLNSHKPAIVAIREELKTYNLTSIVIQSFGNDYLMVKEKDKEKEKEKDKEKDIREIATFEDLFKYWEKHKAGKKYKSVESRKRMLNKLKDLTNNNLPFAKDAICHCIDSGYQGFCNGSELFYKKSTKPAPHSEAAQVRTEQPDRHTPSVPRHQPRSPEVDAEIAKITKGIGKS